MTHEGGWPNDPRSIGRRLAEVLVRNAIILAVVLLTMFLLTKLFGFD